MDFVKVFYSGTPAKVFKLLDKLESTDIGSNIYYLEIHDLLAEELNVEPMSLFGSISEIQGSTYFYTEQHELELTSENKFKLVFDTDELIVEEPVTESTGEE